ncbi:MAG TPA: DUF1844 domain-containing protein [Methylomirabilota bacterium]|jgi:hypothetical protein|nr:DUF1844 domain-containing protein [Methylomirabilota bacterium]
MAAEEQESGRGFRVQDRRRFSPETGEPRGEAEAAKLQENAGEEQPTERSAKDREAHEAYSHSHEPISFSSFILGLITQALMFLGEVAPPPGQTKQVDLGAARQMIDLLAILKEKTKGNLDAAEDAMLENALYDLRIRYVEIAKKNH